MPVAHTFMVFRAAYLYMKREINRLKVHGLMSGSCHDEIEAQLDQRYAFALSCVAHPRTHQPCIFGCAMAMLSSAYNLAGIKTSVPSSATTESVGSG